MRVLALAVLAGLVGCSFSAPHEATDGDGPGDGPGDDAEPFDARVIDAPDGELPVDGMPDATPDAMPDAMPDAAPDAAPVNPCASQTGLFACFAFEQNPLLATQPNEGSAVGVAAQLVNAPRTTRGTAGAVSVGNTTSIIMNAPADPPGVRTFETWVYFIDVPSDPMQRVGIMDGQTSLPSYSLFYYPNGVPGSGGTAPVVRFDHGLKLEVAKTLPLGTWIHLAQVCQENGQMVGYVDGIEVGRLAGCTPVELKPPGLYFGSDNNANTAAQQVHGAIDDVKIWTTARTAAQVCADAERTSCP